MNILVADSGSTKTDWVYIHNNEVESRWKTSGINPMMQTTNSIIATLQSDYSQWSEYEVDVIYFYGAGCIGGEANLVVSQALLSLYGGTPRVEVATDLLGAARALFGNKPGVACILGTGANSGLYDGNELTYNVPPLGFILGDEGSGAHIGKRLVADCLKGLVSEDLTQKLYTWSGLTYRQFIENVYRKPFPNRFLARFAEFAKENIDMPEVQSIVEEAFNSFVERNLLQYEGIEHLQIGFVGSVAVSFEQQIRNVLRRYFDSDIVFVTSPIDGLVKNIIDRDESYNRVE